MYAAATGIIVFIPGELGAKYCVYLEFFAQLSDKSLLRRLPALYLAARKLPFERVPVTLSTLTYKNLTGAIDDSRGHEQRQLISHRDRILNCCPRGREGAEAPRSDYRRAHGQQLPEHVRQYAAVSIVFGFLQRVDSGAHFELDGFVVRLRGNDLHSRSGRN